MFKLFTFTNIIVGSIGVFFGFYFLDTAPQKSIYIVTLSTIGIVGVLAFVRHFIFYKADAKSLGWETDRPDWMFEVGFANLAFGFMGLLAVFANMGMKVCAIALLGYAFYLFQAALLHGYRYFTDEKKSTKRLWRSFLLTLLYSGFMIFFAIRAFILEV